MDKYSRSGINSVLLQYAIAAVIGITLVLTGFQSYWNHQDMRAFMTDPEARPDAWTKTMDDKRTKQLCKAILFRIQHNTSKVVLNTQLPEVCK